MALLNIGASNRDDAFYRYKMPRLLTKIEGRGNGIKTNVVNMVDVAKALARSPAYTTKYFGCELGAQSKFDEKTGTSIVNGAHDTAKLAGLLENFIKKYVQCHACGNPETDINITKTQLINLKCQACGSVSDVDMRDKLTTYILKNPPEQKKGGKKEKGLRKAEKERLDQGELADEEAKKLKKDQRKKKGAVAENDKKARKRTNGNGSDEELSPTASVVDEGEEVAADEDDGVQWQTDTSAEAAKQRIKEQLTTATSEMVMLTIPEKSETSPRVKTPRTPKDKDAKPKLLKKLSSKKSEPPVDAIDENGVVEAPKAEELSPHEKLVKEFRECLQKEYSASQLVACLQSKGDAEQELFAAYFEALFGGLGKGLSKEIKRRISYLSKVVQDESHQKILLDVMQGHCCSVSPDLGNEVAVLLKVLYDADILDEDHIIAWYDSGSSKTKGAEVRRSAEPFVTWLRSAEAESEEED
eukprot:TRINITY_DN4031_c0_g1_i1.p1 TRINITY_DN4031_c0_g1~~TRINITY_DN4031_c0_g1_i1.p1  ORF type:complete len:471 (+),score=128.68 TRINITY_DN4031_c0_g1_i1:424-1836(+)